MATMRAGTRRRVALLLRALGWSAAIAAVFVGASSPAFHDGPLVGVIVDALAGVINVAMVSGAIFGAEIFLPRTRLGHALERAPFLVTFTMKLLVYGTVIVLVFGGGSLGERLALAAAAVALGPDSVAAIHMQIKTPTAPLMARAFLLFGVGILVLQLGRLVGERALRDIVFGRYHRSRTEERFFLFVDVAGSTPLAERIGPDAVHRFLGEVFRLASDPIDDHHGEVFP